MNNFDIWKQGFRDGLPVFFGYLAVSFTFGIAARDILSPFTAVLMSATNYTSAGQFAALGLIAASAAYWEMALAQLVINLRYSLMACFISQKLEAASPFFHRFFIAMGLTDEVFGISASVRGPLRPAYAYGVISSALPGWVLGTFLGLVSSELMSPRVLSAMGIAIYGMFIAIIFPPVRRNFRLGLIIVISMLLNLAAGRLHFLDNITPGLKLILLTLVITGVAALAFPVENDDQHPESGPAPKGGAR